MIYTAKDVKTACNKLLAAAFPDCSIYDNDTLDGYKRPSFFAELHSRDRTRISRCLVQYGYRYRVTYFEETHDEVHCLEVYRKICSVFEPYIVLGNKRKSRLCVEDVGMQWVDEHADKLQVTIDFSDAIELGGGAPEGEETSEYMKTIKMRTEVRVSDSDTEIIYEMEE